MKISIANRVAGINFAPDEWQIGAPVEGWTRKPEIQMSADLRRIIALPRRDQPDGPMAEALVEMMTERYTNGRAAGYGCTCQSVFNRECITRLRVAQAWALYEISVKNGVLGPIGVGHGKTMLDLLAALAFTNCRTAVLLVPPNLVSQLATDYELIGNHFRMPSLMVHGSRPIARTVPGAPVLHVFPYSQLSNKKATIFLETLNPDVMLADEVHLLRHAEAVRTSRVLRFFTGHESCRFAGWSGSITDSSIQDYAHLAALALRDDSPLPLDPNIVEDWARAIDPTENPAPAGALLQICAPGEHLHRGFHRRLVETVGIVATSEPSVDCALVITERKAPPVPPDVLAALRELRSDHVRPDGEELLDALSVSACALELACGFYYRWRFPLIHGVAQKREVIEEWLFARKQWRQEMRWQLKRPEPHLDSPELLAHAAARYHGDRPNPDRLPTWGSSTWPRWHAAKGTVHYESETVRLDPYLAEDASEWALTHRGVVWYQRKAFGTWVAEISGCRLHGGGPDAGPRILRERGDASIIASIKSHGTGRDGLQFLYRDQLIANPSSSATNWEQLLGRLHRTGQRAPEVRAEFYCHTMEMRSQMETALRRAEYVGTTLQGSSGGQKLGASGLAEEFGE